MNLKTIAFLSLVLAAISSSCVNPEKGETLARQQCSACHLFPDPALLDKKTWEKSVFPEMAFRMGLNMSKLPGTNASELEEILKALPSGPLLSQEDWESIQHYYLRTAPDTLEIIPENQPFPLHQFQASALRLNIRAKSKLTMLKTDPATKKIFVGTREGKLYLLKNNLVPEDSFPLGSPPSSIIFSHTGNAFVSCMGIMDPNDQPAGAVLELNSADKNLWLRMDSLKRPVDIQQGDLNNDGQEDLVVSAFGNFTGALLAFEKTGNEYRQHTIHSFPGTRKTILGDFNNDGLTDILALIAQGDERIALFTNRGNFRFSYQVLLKFPPVYGSSYMEIGDFNGDGKQDILYTNGDNADYSAILKPYHGVRLFLNDGKNHFTESWFFPMHGASMARSFDFDEDGDLDIAAISFFPDFKNHPENSFIYLQNDRGKFTAFKTPLAASSRWITLESADIDEDGDADLLLGALAFPAGVPDSLFAVWGKNQNSLLVLRNTLR